jgi:hypothetical protein
MVRLKMKVGSPDKTQSFEGKAIDLTPQEYDRFIQLVNTTELHTGMPVKESLNALTKDPDYADASDEDKELMIRHYLLEAREKAKLQFLDDFPELRGAVDELHMERQTREGSTGSRRRSPQAPPSRTKSYPFM